MRNLKFLAALFALLPLLAASADAYGRDRDGDRGRGGYYGGGHGGVYGSYGGGQGSIIVDGPIPGTGYPTGPSPLPDPYPPRTPYPPYPPDPYPPGPYPAPAPYPTEEAPLPPQAFAAPPAWYFCTSPEGFYPYVEACKEKWRPTEVIPPPPNAPPPPSLLSWQHCLDPDGYFPYVTACKGTWQPVSPNAPAPLRSVKFATWYYCKSSKQYFPYTPSCPEGLASIPAMPPPKPNAPDAEKVTSDQRGTSQPR